MLFVNPVERQVFVDTIAQVFVFLDVDIIAQVFVLFVCAPVLFVNAVDIIAQVFVLLVKPVATI